MTEWKKICSLEEIPLLGSRVVKAQPLDIALFRDGSGEVFALHDRCPHRGGPLSQGIVAGRHVTCPMHGWKIGLADGEAQAPDKGCAGRPEVKVEDGGVYLRLG
ncbi:MAG: nitrite reductase small subunit NirD [Rhodocyclaceae bacterium]|nr:nitrite reductase small subunit NirD [Rhodocyclaceae bacterium]